MEYRKIGSTGMEASVIGFGAEHLDHKPYSQVERVIDRVAEHGINIMDVFMPGEEVRLNIGKALKGKRDKFIIQGHIGSVEKNGQYEINRDLNLCKKGFEAYMHTLKTDYIDCGMLFFIDSEDDYKAVFEGGIADYAQELKQKGIIRAIGASSHNPIIASKVVETGIVEMLLFSINPAFDLFPVETNALDQLATLDSGKFVGMDPARADFYRLCENRGIGLTVMKALGAGKLLSPEHTPFKEPLTVAQCIHYALTRPAVSSVLLGYSEPEHVDQAMEYLSMTDEQKDYSSAISQFQQNFSGSCVYCSHCEPCPVGIDIANVNKYLDIALLDSSNVAPSIRHHYESMSSHGEDCIQCGNCESRCPFNVPIIGNMEQASNIFGK